MSSKSLAALVSLPYLYLDNSGPFTAGAGAIARSAPTDMDIAYARERRLRERDTKDQRVLASGKIGPKRRRRIANRTGKGMG